MSGPNANANEVPERANDQSTVGKPGDPLMNPKTEPGYILLGLSFIAFVLAIVSAANDLTSWLWIALAVCVVCGLAGIAWVLFQRGRLKQAMRHNTHEVPPDLRRKWRMSRGA